MGTEMSRILVVDDDPGIASALARGLALYDCAAECELRADRARDRLRGGGFDAAVVDVMLGSDSGIDLIRGLRAEGLQVPVVMLSALSGVEDRAAGLDAGADDYIVKPFSIDELVARLRVQARRRPGRPPDAVLDPAGRRLHAGGRSVSLTEREFALLSLLVRHAGTPLSRGRIFDTLWAAEGTSSENVVDVYVGYLRRKIGPVSESGFEVQTVRNHGFALSGTPPRLC